MSARTVAPRPNVCSGALRPNDNPVRSNALSAAQAAGRWRRPMPVVVEIGDGEFLSDPLRRERRPCVETSRNRPPMPHSRSFCVRQVRLKGATCR